MTTSVGNWVGEITTTTGRGDITLGGAKAGGFTTFASINDVFNVSNNGEFYYAIVEGSNREAGKGTVAGDVFSRDTVISTLENGIYNDNNPQPIDLKGNAEIFSTFNKEAFDLIFKHLDDAKDFKDRIEDLEALILTKVDRAGDTMTGQLKTLTPVADEDAANKVYVDSEVTKSNLYLGSFTKDPTPAEVGLTSFVDGNNYYNTTLNSTMVYHISTGKFDSIVTPTPAILNTFKYIADGVKKAFSGADKNGNTFSPLDAASNPVEVYVAGLLQDAPLDYSIDYTAKVINLVKVPRAGQTVRADVLVDPTASAVTQPYVLTDTAALAAQTGTTVSDKLTSAIAPDAVVNGVTVYVGYDSTFGANNAWSGVWIYDGMWKHAVDLSSIKSSVSVYTTTAATVRAQAAPAEADGVTVLNSSFAAIFPAGKEEEGNIVVVTAGAATDAAYDGVFRYTGGAWTVFATTFKSNLIKGFIKATAATADNPVTNVPTASYQATVKDGEREFKVLSGTAWKLLFSETEIRKWITQGTNFRTTIYPKRTWNTGIKWLYGQITLDGGKYWQVINRNGLDGTTTPLAVPTAGTDWQEVQTNPSVTSPPFIMLLENLPAPAAGNKGWYWTFNDPQSYTLSAADGQAFAALGAVTVSAGDWLQSSGTSYSQIISNFLTRLAWESIGTFQEYDPTIGNPVENNQLIRWRATPTDSYRFYRAGASATSPTKLPSDPTSVWTDITPALKPEELDGLSGTLNVPVDDGVLIYNTTLAVWEIRKAPMVLEPWSAPATFKQGELSYKVVGTQTVIYRSLSAGNTGNDPETDAVNWESVNFPTLTSLTDTTIAAGAHRDILYLDGADSKWKNIKLETYLAHDPQAAYAVGDLAFVGGASPAWYVASSAIAAPADPLVPNPSPAVDARNWTRVGGGTTIGSLSDVDTTTTAPVEGDNLTWSVADGAWIPKASAAAGGIAPYAPTLTYPVNSYVEYQNALYTNKVVVPAGVAPESTVNTTTIATTTQASQATLANNGEAGKTNAENFGKTSAILQTIGQYYKFDGGAPAGGYPYTITTGEAAGMVVTERYGWMLIADKTDPAVLGNGGYHFIPASDGSDPANPNAPSNNPPATVDVPDNGLSTNPWQYLGKAPDKISDIGNVTESPTPAAGDILESDGAGAWTERANPSYTRAEVDALIAAVISGLSHGVAVASYTETPPVAPTPDVFYIIKPTGTGAWAGQDNELTYWDGLQWVFIPPEPDATHLVEDVSENWHWNGASWVKISGGSGAAAGDIYMVGDVRESSLTETQFKAQLTTSEQSKWVLADGRNVAGTQYAIVTGKNTVPDLRGAYLRMAGQNATNVAWNGGALGDWQEDATARPTAPFTTDQQGNHYHSLGWYDQEPQDIVQQYHNHTGANPSPQVAHMFKIEDPGQGGGGAEGQAIEKEMAVSTDGNHNHSITGGGDTETRPKTYTVNYFIRIN